MKRAYVLAAALAVTGVSVGAVAQAEGLITNPTQVKSGSYVLDASHGKVTWSLSHMGFSTYVGQFTAVDAKLDLNTANPSASRLVANVKTDSVGTLNDALDTHLKAADFLDAAKHPTATFQATGIKMTDADSVEISGNLTLRGITKPIVMQAEFNQAGISPASKKYTVGFDGEATIKRSDFGISYGLPLLGDEVKLHMEAEFTLADQTKGTK